MTHGIITSVEDHGSIVICWVQSDDDDCRESPIYFDHRMFRDFAESNGGFIGLRVSYDDNSKELSIE